MLYIMIEIELKQRVLDAIDDLRPYLKNDGGDMELVTITPEKKVVVRFLGACQTCSVRPVTLKAGLEESLRVVAPEISGVESIES
jgi:Fe-S cluster biogenesis protein NfuA